MGITRTLSFAPTTNTDTMTPNEENVVIIIMDNSGSMGSPASDDPECIGFTRNDFSRQGAMLCVKGTPENTSLIVISFDDRAKIVSPLMKMTEANKMIACDNIKTIMPCGGTHIMSGMNAAFEIARQNVGRCKTNIIMFTDGEDSNLNDTNVSSKFDILRIGGEFCFRMDTVGFGPNANTKLLVKMADLCSGTYALCFDASMVGTIFGRAITRTYLDDDVYGVHVSHDITNLSFTNLTEYYNIKNKYNDFREKISTILLNSEHSLIQLQSNLNLIIDEIKVFLQNQKDIDELAQFWQSLIQTLYDDLNDQIMLAVSSDTFWIKWGKAYWYTVGIALQKMYSPNFKDKCLQCFGTKKAIDEYDRICDIYDNMPMIKPSGSVARRTTAVPIYAAAFNNREAVCFHPNSILTMFNGMDITFSNLELLLNTSSQSVFLHGPNGPVQVEKLIKTNVNGSTKFCNVGDCVLTPNHPIIVNGIWTHPQMVSPVYEEHIDCVYNLILTINQNTSKRDSAVIVNNEVCICLAHGIEYDPVATDQFWGTEKVVQELMKISSDYHNTRTIEISASIIRNEKTGYAVGFEIA